MKSNASNGLMFSLVVCVFFCIAFLLSFLCFLRGVYAYASTFNAIAALPSSA